MGAGVDRMTAHDVEGKRQRGGNGVQEESRPAGGMSTEYGVRNRRVRLVLKSARPGVEFARSVGGQKVGFRQGVTSGRMRQLRTSRWGRVALMAANSGRSGEDLCKEQHSLVEVLALAKSDSVITHTNSGETTSNRSAPFFDPDLFSPPLYERHHHGSIDPSLWPADRD